MNSLRDMIVFWNTWKCQIFLYEIEWYHRRNIMKSFENGYSRLENAF